nr:DUF1731 domain-containing protein [Amycolatopsis sp. CA-126428]
MAARRLTAAGHEFRHPSLADALGHLLGTAADLIDSAAGDRA